MTYNRCLHRFASLVACCTLVLVFVGGLVTSTDSGLAVPDWPLSYGQVFPPMVGGVFYEHGHRMVAATVGVLTIILAVWLWKRESRQWLRRLGVVALLAVVAQGLLGGLTVLFHLPTPVSVAHAGMAQIFLCLTVSIAVFTSRSWQDAPPQSGGPHAASLRAWAPAATVMIYLQTLIGALMRHTRSGLAIPDYPLSFGRLVPPDFSFPVLVNFAHRTWALAVAIAIVWLSVRILRSRRAAALLQGPAVALLGAVMIQIMLGAETIWSTRAVLPTTLHVTGGAFLLATSVVLALRVHRTFAAPHGAPVVRTTAP